MYTYNTYYLRHVRKLRIPRVRYTYNMYGICIYYVPTRARLCELPGHGAGAREIVYEPHQTPLSERAISKLELNAIKLF